MSASHPLSPPTAVQTACDQLRRRRLRAACVSRLAGLQIFIWRAVWIVRPSLFVWLRFLKRLIANHGAPIAFHRGVMRATSCAASMPRSHLSVHPDPAPQRLRCTADRILTKINGFQSRRHVGLTFSSSTVQARRELPAAWTGPAKKSRTCRNDRAAA